MNKFCTKLLSAVVVGASFFSMIIPAFATNKSVGTPFEQFGVTAVIIDDSLENNNGYSFESNLTDVLVRKYASELLDYNNGNSVVVMPSASDLQDVATENTEISRVLAAFDVVVSDKSVFNGGQTRDIMFCLGENIVLSNGYTLALKHWDGLRWEAIPTQTIQCPAPKHNDIAVIGTFSSLSPVVLVTEKASADEIIEPDDNNQMEQEHEPDVDAIDDPVQQDAPNIDNENPAASLFFAVKSLLPVIAFAALACCLAIILVLRKKH